ncbi:MULTISPECIES: ABC transporter substrate-binding protein [Cyanophyceae]|uniref:ABC transporter substrate-binding protein n=1 Tax=Cyanophyceae TaxID=3028117 RepID=UPI002330BA42|nr:MULTISPECIES: ABC transporter substrate-binding protein [Cyanophyceae]MDB9304339.1 ABC transporter substrate-binding protein [Nodularia spumigena CS-591/12]MDB9316499.1 ABC transporter substrate-binding protein [Nodularia spumigena CS-590/01A]MDB9322204.1 ABC transporter substrate-binding protein [Nodularia spumigena CS-591/07A]MDB9327253.1 ABC transporter substrate-binding protein [Nodularia spumigena CS-590/02]MDB9329148.1 ABC transporter substrate-binding protein [Nodularia spumigena CS-
MQYYFKSLLLLLLVGILALGGCQTMRTAKTGVIHLTLWQGVNPPPNRDVLQKLVDKFNQTHPKIQVESLYAGQQDQQTPKILAAVVGNAPPDLLWYNPTIAGQLVELQALIPLDEKLNNSPVKAEIDPALFESMEYQGQIWSVPFATNNVAVYYRPSLFKAAGITELPRTWEQFREVAKRLTRDTNGDGRINQYGMFLPLGKGEFTVFTWLPFMWSSGGELVKGETEKAAGVMLQNNPGAIAALQFWRNLIVDGSAMLSSPERGYETGDLIAGNVAMQVTGPWSLGEFTASGVDFGVFPIPVNQQPATSVGGENLFLFKTTPEREKAAFTFAEYAMSAEFQTELALGTGYLPINLKSRQDAQYQEFVKKLPPVQVFLDQAEHGRSRPIFPGYNRISDSLGRAIESVLLSQNTPEQALKITQQRLDLIFK